ncbi:antibiotic biosynthesis monooxygenase [Ulvibacterium sp.]|uniref:putative quinol monooxygenase n=1 Tax=Ulvibacterium sp. TaxID=2665914 RepID=UPI00260BDF2F|nr:antibiotic biosynthesis monooxygenase [Ulvibacterium sp.]
MLVRIVKLTFKKENIASFERIFAETRQKIQAFKGCTLLELYQDMDNPAVFFTQSHWEDAKCLDDYRQSNLFRETWNKTKVLFDAKPEAWSLSKKMG